MTTSTCWPNGARLAVSFSLMFEGGGQPISGAGGVIPDPIALTAAVFFLALRLLFPEVSEPIFW
jgi:hypothetical protein